MDEKYEAWRDSLTEEETADLLDMYDTLLDAYNAKIDEYNEDAFEDHRAGIIDWDEI